MAEEVRSENQSCGTAQLGQRRARSRAEETLQLVATTTVDDHTARSRGRRTASNGTVARRGDNPRNG